MGEQYLRCAAGGCPGTNFAVVVNEQGAVVRRECQRCGGTETEVGMRA